MIRIEYNLAGMLTRLPTKIAKMKLSCQKHGSQRACLIVARETLEISPETVYQNSK